MSKTSKTWAAVILTALTLSGCGAPRTPVGESSPTTLTVANVSNTSGAAAAQAALLSLPGTTPVQASGYETVGCMDFGWGGRGRSTSGRDTAKLIALGIVFSPVLVVLGVLYLLAW